MAKKLDMGATTIGYSATGISKLITAITDGIEAGAKKVDPKTSSSYTTLIDTLRTYWDGVDEANFEADLKLAAEKLASSLRGYKTIITAVLTNYKNAFGKFQNQTYGKGSITIK